MNYKPNPLLYAAHEDFWSSFKLILTMRDKVDHSVLSRSVAKAMTRYPYFCIYPEKDGNCIRLQHNPSPVPVFADGRCVTLGSEESNGNLLTFGCEENRVIINASHFIADGMGIEPVWKAVLYFYVSELYGENGLAIDKFELPNGAVSPKEYECPFPDKPFEIDPFFLPKNTPKDVYSLNEKRFDDNGCYAYHLHVPQKAMMAKANPSDGSPVSFLSVLLYRALNKLDPELDQPVVVHVQHQYRAPLCAFESRHSMVCYIPITLSAKMKSWPMLKQNTVVRGQVLLGVESTTDQNAVNQLLKAFPCEEGACLADKKAAMRKYVDNSIKGKTFGISYVGKTNWCGLDQYVKDIHAYIGEKHSKNTLIIEVMTIGEDFTLNFMQSGKGDEYVNAFIEQLQSFDIPVRITGEERYTLSDTMIPD